MVKGGKKTNIGYMYSVMDELQRLRESNAALTEKNRDLAKQLVRFPRCQNGTASC
jgi:hypothetical protein